MREKKELTIRNCGQIEILNSIKKSTGHKTLNEFLINLSENLIKRSALFLQNVQSYPAYAYSEKSFHTILTPAIDSITKNYLIEFPIRRIAKGKRNQPKKDGHGWADYWIGHNNIEIFLELKHGWVATNSKSNSTRQQIQKNLWDVMNTQLDHLEHDAKEYQSQMKKSQTFFRVGMMILPFYQWSTTKEKIITNKLHFQDIYNNISKDLSPKPNWAGLFWMHSNFQEDLLSEENGRYCNRPGFMILLNVKEISKPIS